MGDAVSKRHALQTETMVEGDSPVIQGAQPEPAEDARVGDGSTVEGGVEGSIAEAESKQDNAAKGDAASIEGPVSAQELGLGDEAERATLVEKAQVGVLEGGRKEGSAEEGASSAQVVASNPERPGEGGAEDRGGARAEKEGNGAELASEGANEGQKASDPEERTGPMDAEKGGIASTRVDGPDCAGALEAARSFGTEGIPAQVESNAGPLVGGPDSGAIAWPFEDGKGEGKGEKAEQETLGQADSVLVAEAEPITKQNAEPKPGEDQSKAGGGDTLDAAFPNAPGSGGYLARSHPSFNRGKSFGHSPGEEKADTRSLAPSKGDLVLNLVNDLGPIRAGGQFSSGGILPLTSTDQPGAATWQQQLLALQNSGKAGGGEDLAVGPLVRKSEGLSQDLNLTWAGVAEADHASEEVTKNLEAQLAVLQKVAATRFGDKSGAPPSVEKESHEETMRKLKAELASLEQRAAAQNLHKKGGQSVRGRGRGFAELRMAVPPGLNLGAPVSVSGEAVGASTEELLREGSEGGLTRLRKRRRPNGSYNCQVEGCEENLEHAKAYNKRHHVCWVHSRAWEVLIHGVLSRFCQQCSRFHDVRAFDEIKRSCRERLLHHNKRRRTILDMGDAARGSGDVSDKEKEPPPPAKDSAAKVKRARPPPQDTPPKSAPEPDPLARALDTLMKAREQLGGGRTDISRPPPDRLTFSTAPGPPPGTYESNPLNRPGANLLLNPTTPMRHNSTELTLSRRTSGFEVLDQVTGRAGGGVNTFPLGGSLAQSFQSPPGEQYPPAPMSRQLASVPTGFERLLQTPPRAESAGQGVDRAHSPFLDILMRSQHALRDPSPQKGFELTQHRFSQALQEAEKAQLERPNDLASEVAIRSPLLAAYVPEYDGMRAARAGNNAATNNTANSSLRSPTYDMLTDFIGGGQRGGGTLPLGFAERDAGGGQSLFDSGLGMARDHSSAHASSLLRLMSSHVESASPVKEPTNFLRGLDGPLGLYGLPSQGHVQPPRDQPGSWLANNDQREQTAALHREFQRLIQSQTRAADLGGGAEGAQAPFAGLSSQLGFQGQEPALGNRGFKLNDWTFN
ncbi:squamosa promoter binding protein(SBP) domain containing protein [Klebsormidium nitens]|uniref:Squamosa promoter binding protein(SBP) domain containing protein n=1 Tax=Klebsormidium nitens TaxID=105231 RepID=A0A1Y1HYN7_KLENI|nr:squamosa promoter binding protein(SBP) domain containing protein [Klebsormidium nitens]|eukprot:GAQ82309.1 squamosa promoter binding protein(SBP) domain containing protein [Klebsormidium nitens]